MQPRSLAMLSAMTSACCCWTAVAARGGGAAECMESAAVGIIAGTDTARGTDRAVDTAGTAEVSAAAITTVGTGCVF